MKIRHGARFALLCFMAMVVFKGASGQEPVSPPASQQGGQGELNAPMVTTVIIRPQQIGFYVLDTKNRRVFVDDLARERFRVSEKVPGKGWQTPEVKSVFGGEQPLLLALVLDTSASVFQREAGSVKKILQDFLLTAMRQEKDAALLLPFREFVDNTRSFTGDVGILVRDIGSLKGGGGTALFDALLVAVWRLEEEEINRGIGEYRKVIILLSDGQENASAINTERFGGDAVKAHIAKKELVEYMILGGDIPVYTLFPSTEQQERMPLMMQGVWSSRESSGEWLRKISRESGGTFLPFMGDRERRNAFARVKEELTHKYWLLFYPVPPAKNEESRGIRIEVIAVDEKGKVEKDKRYRVVAPPRFYLQKTAPGP